VNDRAQPLDLPARDAELRVHGECAAAAISIRTNILAVAAKR